MAASVVDEQILELLQALDRVGNETALAASRLQEAPEWERFATFREFRQKSQEFEALTTLVATNFNKLDERIADSLRGEFDRLDEKALILSIDTSRNFAAVIGTGLLPLWSEDLISTELATLDGLADRVRRTTLTQRANEVLLQDIEDTKATLAAMIRTLPRIEDFGRLSAA